jgi:hypothetical protein
MRSACWGSACCTQQQHVVEFVLFLYLISLNQTQGRHWINIFQSQHDESVTDLHFPQYLALHCSSRFEEVLIPRRDSSFNSQALQ